MQLSLQLLNGVILSAVMAVVAVVGIRRNAALKRLCRCRFDCCRLLVGEKWFLLDTVHHHDYHLVSPVLLIQPLGYTSRCRRRRRGIARFVARHGHANLCFLWTIGSVIVMNRTIDWHCVLHSAALRCLVRSLLLSCLVSCFVDADCCEPLGSPVQLTHTYNRGDEFVAVTVFRIGRWILSLLARNGQR